MFKFFEPVANCDQFIKFIVTKLKTEVLILFAVREFAIAGEDRKCYLLPLNKTPALEFKLEIAFFPKPLFQFSPIGCWVRALRQNSHYIHNGNNPLQW